MYKLIYDGITGKVTGVERRDGANIPLCEDNSNYQDFLEWNLQQKIPLDLNSTIEVVKPAPARDYLAEIDIMKADIVKLKAGKVDKV